jgi:tetratricopeptide (TPR) repeat protein
MERQESSETVRRGGGWLVAAVCSVLAAITFAVFGQTVRFGFVNYDDISYVYDNPVVVRGLTWHGLVWVFTHAECRFYHPLTMLSLMADHQFYGLQAGGYHLTNVLLHTGSVILLFLVLRQMTGALWRSAFVSVVFAIHPLRAESVAWVAERKDVLGAFFFMVTLCAYARYVSRPDSRGRYLMVAGAFALALLSKPTVVTLPFVLLLLDYWPLRRFEMSGPADSSGYFGIPRRFIMEKIPLLLLAAGACAIAVVAARKFIHPPVRLSMLSRMGNMLVYYTIYLGKIFWPERLAVPYPFPPNGLPPWEITLAGMLLAGLSLLAWRERGRRPWLLMGWLWYLGMLVPMIGLTPVGAFPLADRYTYLAQIGICLAVTWLVGEWRLNSAALRVLLAGVVGVLGLCGWKQTGYWKDSETLWTRALNCTTDNEVAHNNLGALLFAENKVDEALRHFQKAVEIAPGYEDARNNLGSALLRKGRVDEAIAQYQKALALDPKASKYQNNLILGNTLLRKGRAEEAVFHLRQALENDPDNAEVQCNLGNALLQDGRVEEALVHYQRALALKPGQAGAHCGYGNALLRKGRVEEAIAQYQQALALKPGYGEAQCNWGGALVQEGKGEEAMAHYQKALELEPDNAEAHYNLGNMLRQKGRVEEALAQYELALQSKPDYGPARYNLGNLLLKGGRVEEALAQYEEVLRQTPDYAEARVNMGIALLQKGRVGEAIEQLQRALQINPEYEAARINLGNAYLKAGQAAAAVGQWRRALQLEPGNAGVLNSLAWLLATGKEASVRDGKGAVELARQADGLTGGSNGYVLRTLAAAYAEAGRYEEAAATARRALGVAVGQGDGVLAGQLRAELKLYEGGKACHAAEAPH